MYKYLIAFLIFSSASFIYGQSTDSGTAQMKLLTGILSQDARISFDKSEKLIIDDVKNQAGEKKSVLLAGALSFVLPGAGEFYNESYIKSAVFVTLEVAAIAIGLCYTKKGDDQTNYFQNYANIHWDVKQYAAWTVSHAASINAQVDPSKFNVLIYTNGKVTDVNWSELNRLESALGSYYSHQLPKFGEQQYYELIGKYQQFNVGWDQFNPNSSYTYGDPLVPEFGEYSLMRGQANDYYNVAAKAVVFIVINHVLSTVDAALSANSYNRRLEMHASLEKINCGYKTVYYPQVNLQFRF